MIEMPNPFTDSAASSESAADTAVAAIQPPVATAGTLSNSALERAIAAGSGAAPDLTDPPVAAPVLIDEPPSNEGRYPEAPAVDQPNTAATAGATDCIGEIFHHARKLVADDHRFVLDEQLFMEAIEPPPLFLQYLRAGFAR
jgi:hypothetical protein